MARSARPAEIPNQYQVIVAKPATITRYARAYSPKERRWTGDTRIDPDGAAWQVSSAWQPASVHGIFPDTSPARTRPLRTEPASLGEDFVDRVAEVCRLRHPGAMVTRVETDGLAYLRVTHPEDRLAVQRPVGVTASIDPAVIDRFVETVHRAYLASDPQLVSELVHSGSQAPPELVRDVYRRGVRLLSFVEYQGLLDLRGYVATQRTRLERDQLYPPKLYVPQRYQMLEEPDAAPRDDVLAELIGWLSSDQARFVLLLGDFGRGKTFLLHELARQLPEHLPHVVPMLVELRGLEKARTVDELVAQHVAASGVDRIDFPAFRYMLRTGRIVLLLDGFDELALRVSYERAADHLRTLMDAVDGQAKVVLTSRTQHFISDAQVHTALGARVDLVPGRRLAHLEDFTDEQIRSFLVGLFGGDTARAEARLELIKDVRDLLGLSRNPRMLSFIAALPEERLRVAQAVSGSIGSAELYRELLGQWLGYEDRRACPPGSALGLGLDERWSAVTALALRLWATTDRYIGLAELDAVAARLVADLVDRQLDADQAAQMIGSGTLLSRTEDGLFTFVHQSVMEWLVAAEAARLIADGDPSPDVLSVRSMSPLMADFFCGLARKGASDWEAAVLASDTGTEVAKDNALLVRTRLGEASTRLKLADHDLRSADLTKKDYAGADLTGADLRGARLVETNLSGAVLHRTRLGDTRLTSTNLVKADLTGADLTGARLRDVDLRGATLTGSRWTYAALLGSSADDLDADLLAPAAIPARDPHERILQPPPAGATSVAFSADGYLCAVGRQDGTVSIVDAQSGEVRRILRGHGAAVTAVAYSGDGLELASTSEDRTIQIWDPVTGRLTTTLTGHAKWVTALAYSPDGSHLATAGSDRTVRLWHRGSGRCTVLHGHSRPVTALAYSPDGQRLASASSDRTVRIWDTDLASQVTVLLGHTEPVWAVAWAPGAGQVATGSGDATVRLWDPVTSEETLVLTGHTEPVWTVAYSPAGSILASGGGDATVRLWDSTTGELVKVLTGHRRSVYAVAYGPVGTRLATASSDATVRLWNPASGQHTIVGGQVDWVGGLAWSPDGEQLASVGNDRAVRLWASATGQQSAALTGHDEAVTAVAYSPDGGQLATAGLDRAVRLWNPATGEHTTLTGHTNAVTALAWSPDGIQLATGGNDRTVRLWNLDTDEQVTLDEHTEGVFSLAYAPDGKSLAVVGADQKVALWDPLTDQAMTEVDLPSTVAVAWSPDGGRLAAAGADRAVRVWNRTTGEYLTLTGHAEAVCAIAYSPDGRQMATGGEDRTVRLWDPRAAREVKMLVGHTGPVYAVAYSPDGLLLATAGADGGIRLWDPASGAELAILLGLPEGGYAVLLPDGRYKLKGDAAGRFWWAIKMCRFEPGELDPYVPGIRRLPAEAPIVV